MAINYFIYREPGKLSASQLRNLQKFLPTEEESYDLQKFSKTNPNDLKLLGDCEKFMLAMMKVPDINIKFDCMIFQLQFKTQLDELMNEVKLVENACDSVRESKRLKRLLATVLKLGNQINSDGSSADSAVAFRLETLLKLSEV